MAELWSLQDLLGPSYLDLYCPPQVCSLFFSLILITVLHILYFPHLSCLFFFFPMTRIKDHAGQELHSSKTTIHIDYNIFTVYACVSITGKMYKVALISP